MYKEIEKLLLLSKKGDKKAKETLLLKLNPLIISSIRRYYNKIDQYDDLIQEGYEIILKAIENYNPNRGVKFLGYVKAMLRYGYLEKHREKQILSLNEPLEEGEFIDLLEGSEEDPVDAVIKKEEKYLLLESLNCLTERQKQVVVDYYINRLSIDEIANKLGISYRTVVNTKTQGIKKLKNRMVK
ncbi:sigma-70 family RNA polymerase sigma factor [Clostridium sp. Cult1]|uniref:sigma-70 family RNA polymerase sigma factor n=1 Tax=Clostridium sp. Cult1 TaxID=2079002 RepID=UPI001F4460C3|nr:sigma-70 family RNA polymerase sigma factor [Clostridium sp. Cult1]